MPIYYREDSAKYKEWQAKEQAALVEKKKAQELEKVNAKGKATKQWSRTVFKLISCIGL